jgi:hypothetical protein
MWDALTKITTCRVYVYTSRGEYGPLYRRLRGHLSRAEAQAIIEQRPPRLFGPESPEGARVDVVSVEHEVDCRVENGC